MVTFDQQHATSRAPHTTHTVTNQPPPLLDYNLFTTDAILMEALQREDASWAHVQLETAGSFAGSQQAIEWARAANTFSPSLHTHDRYGHRIDEVEFHPAWHNLLQTSISWGSHALSWRSTQTGSHVARAAFFYLSSQMEAGHCCPLSMTHAAVPVLRTQPTIAAQWEPLLTSLDYDPGLRPLQQKRGLLSGMGMTEKQGGSDVRANTTTANPIGENAYLLTGHKWFCSAPMSDLFLVLAQAPRGLSCFLLPRVLPAGTHNTFSIQRLKDKLGNRSNASSEVEFADTWALLIGEEGRGVRTIIDMVNSTRLDCVIGAAAGMRQALVNAIHHARYRSAFGHPLLSQPLMQNVLADLALESEAATVLALRLARAHEQAANNPQQMALKRIGTAIAKYWTTKRVSTLTAEALECLGGNGYVEESIMPRLHREAPLNSIWEGSGNVNCIDVLRAMHKEPHTVEAFFAEIAPARALDKRLDRSIQHLQNELADPSNIETRARRLVEHMALVLQASLLLQHSPSFISDAFCASRLSGDWGHSFGTLPPTTDFPAIIARAFPPLTP